MEKRKRSTRVWQKLKIAQEHNKAIRKLKEKNYLFNDCSILSRAKGKWQQNLNKVSKRLRILVFDNILKMLSDYLFHF